MFFSHFSLHYAGIFLHIVHRLVGADDGELCFTALSEETNMSNQRQGFEFGCKLFYCAHWFHLNEAEFARLLAEPAAKLRSLMELVDALENANPETHNACIEGWCANSHEQLGGTSPEEAVKEGRIGEVIELVRQLGKLPGEETIEG